jgi:hypothetical protein
MLKIKPVKGQTSCKAGAESHGFPIVSRVVWKRGVGLLLTHNCKWRLPTPRPQLQSLHHDLVGFCVEYAIEDWAIFGRGRKRQLKLSLEPNRQRKGGIS